MRVAIVGTSPLGVATAELLVRRGHDVVLVEQDKEKITTLSDSLDCGFVHGNGTKPAILREIHPTETDFLFCLTDNDQDNILAGLVGRSLGFDRVVPKIEDPEFEHICLELGLSDTIIPDSAIARTLVDMVAGQALPELSIIVRGEVRLFSFVARAEDAGPVGELDLPDRTRAVCIYRDEDFLLPDDETELAKGDEIVLITHSRNLPALNKRWSMPKPAARSARAKDDAAET